MLSVSKSVQLGLGAPIKSFENPLLSVGSEEPPMVYKWEKGVPLTGVRAGMALVVNASLGLHVRKLRENVSSLFQKRK